MSNLGYISVVPVIESMVTKTDCSETNKCKVERIPVRHFSEEKTVLIGCLRSIKMRDGFVLESVINFCRRFVVKSEISFRIRTILNNSQYFKIFYLNLVDH